MTETIPCSRNLQDIEDFIVLDSILHSITFVHRIVESAETLFRIPQIGRMVPEFNRSDLRELIFRGYRIVYLLQDNEVLILRLVHGARDLPALLHRKPWDIGG